MRPKQTIGKRLLKKRETNTIRRKFTLLNPDDFIPSLIKVAKEHGMRVKSGEDPNAIGGIKYTHILQHKEWISINPNTLLP